MASETVLSMQDQGYKIIKICSIGARCVVRRRGSSLVIFLPGYSSFIELATL